MAIAANKVPGVRAAVAWNEEIARLSRQHNDANVLAFGSRVVGEGVAIMIVDAWLGGIYDGGRHATRVGQIADFTAKNPDIKVRDLVEHPPSYSDCGCRYLFG